LLTQTWEGNVRQLQNCIERAVTLCEPGDRIGPDLLQAPFARPTSAAGSERRGTLREVVESAESEAIRAALEARGGVRSLAAHDLGVSRQYLHTLIKKYGLQPRRRGDKSD
jgi:Nif-specific regulatory protein